MPNEQEILRENISTFRQLLTEAVADKRIVNAINNYQYIYIYYEGDETISKGYRTIRPMRLGLLQSKTTDKDGNPIPNHNGELALRAWQDKGDSDSFKWGDKKGRRRPEHEYWSDRPGWRLFFVDNISEVLPTGLRFVDKNGKVMIPPKYKETDKQIPTAIAYVSISQDKEMMVKGTDSLDQPDMVAQKVDKSAFAGQAKRFQDFFDVTKRGKNITKDNLQGLYDMIRLQKKKSPNNYLVVLDKYGNFRTIHISQKDKLPQKAIIGNLMTLYDKMIRPPASSDTEMKKFVDRTKQNISKNVPVKENIEKFPIVRKTFFK